MLFSMELYERAPPNPPFLAPATAPERDWMSESSLARTKIDPLVARGFALFDELEIDASTSFSMKFSETVPEAPSVSLDAAIPAAADVISLSLIALRVRVLLCSKVDPLIAAFVVL